MGRAGRASRGLLTALAVALTAVPVAQAAGPGGWENVGGGLNDRVLALNTDQPGVLLVGGTFTDAGGNTSADAIAGWNGSTWSAFGPSGSLNGAVNAIAFANNMVIAGGGFTNAGGSGANYLAAWNGSAWQSICAPLNAQVLSLEVVGSTLYIGGSFLNVNGDPAGDQMVKCDLNTNVTSNVVDSDADLDGGVQALAADASGNVYAGGTFINMDGIPQADYVAKYNGSSWSAMGAGSGVGQGAIDTANVDSLASDGTNVYVGADDVDIADIPAADHVARWDGAAWNAVGSNGAGDGYLPATAAVNGLLTSGSSVYAIGQWANAGGDATADSVAMFNGTSWGAVGSNGAGDGPWIGPGFALAMFGGEPVAGGNFTNAGGDDLADRIASFPAPVVTPPPAGPATATLDKTPRKKIETTKKKAKVTFTFSSDAASGFLCRLDKAAFAACTSPKKVKAKVGKHTFQVEALNADGVAGAPDSFKFKVVRKH